MMSSDFGASGASTGYFLKILGHMVLGLSGVSDLENFIYIIYLAS